MSKINRHPERVLENRPCSQLVKPAPLIHIGIVDYQKKSNGWQTFYEHFGILSVAIVAFMVSLVLKLSLAFSISFCVATFALMIFGGTLIGYAKFPVYRSGRFLTFGLKSVPQPLAAYYRWGWGLFLFGVVLALCLLLSHP